MFLKYRYLNEKVRHPKRQTMKKADRHRRHHLSTGLLRSEKTIFYVGLCQVNCFGCLLTDIVEIIFHHYDIIRSLWHVGTSQQVFIFRE